MELPKHFSTTIIERRGQLGMKQSEVAEAAGLARTLLSRFENGVATAINDKQVRAGTFARARPDDAPRDRLGQVGGST